MLSAAHTWSLTAIAMAAGATLAWAFGRFSDQERLALVKRKLRASLYAFRLYGDEPALIFRAQKQLLLWNARYLALLLRPMALTIVPTLVLLIALDAVYAHRPLAAGESAIVTAQLNRVAGLDMPMPSLEGRGIAVETPTVRLTDQHQVCWRVRAIGAAPGSVLLHVAGASMVKAVQAGSGLRYISERRVSSLFDWLRYPGESRLPAGAVRWIEVSYPAGAIDVFGFAINWLVWFCAVSLLAALALRGRFGGVL
ncbi:MAG: hypothetical protein ABSH32_09580 [Bryobacteraceae bacterium]|jgi:hypothetical protein